MPPWARRRTRLAILLATASAVLVWAVVFTAVTRSPATLSRASTTTVSPTVVPTTTPSTNTTVPAMTSPSRATTSEPTVTAPPTTAPPRQAIVVRRGSPDVPLVALTFDAGSDVGYTAEILDILAANGIRATFGVTGRWADANPALVQRLAADHHQIVNHTYDHPSFNGHSTGTAALTRAERLDQLARADAAIVAAGGGSTVPWFRPPYGDEDESVRRDVAVAGYGFEVMWSVDSLGWRGLPPDQVVDRCLDQAAAGVIYLFHVGAASTDHAAVASIIDGLRARGLGFATVAELVRV